MTLPASGNTISLYQVNTELVRSGTATIDMNDSAVRSLFGKAGSGTTISMSDGWGKSGISLSVLNSLYGTAWYYAPPAYSEIWFYTTGGISGNASNQGGFTGSWTGSSSAGASYWVRCTQTSAYSSTTETGNARGTWHQLSTNRMFGISRTLNGAGGRTYTFQIASDSAGSNIVATVTGISLEAELLF